MRRFLARPFAQNVGAPRRDVLRTQENAPKSKATALEQLNLATYKIAAIYASSRDEGSDALRIKQARNFFWKCVKKINFSPEEKQKIQPLLEIAEQGNWTEETVTNFMRQYRDIF